MPVEEVSDRPFSIAVTWLTDTAERLGFGVKHLFRGTVFYRDKKKLVKYLEKCGFTVLTCEEGVLPSSSIIPVIPKSADEVIGHCKHCDYRCCQSVRADNNGHCKTWRSRITHTKDGRNTTLIEKEIIDSMHREQEDIEG